MVEISVNIHISNKKLFISNVKLRFSIMFVLLQELLFHFFYFCSDTDLQQLYMEKILEKLHVSNNVPPM